jgi:sphinganine-1-phosphate aldolase
VLVAASAPSYPHGVIDPVPQIAAAAAARGVRCHVDAGVAGWLLPYLPRRLPGWSFTAPGVTSMTVNLDTYGYAPKGAAVLLHRTPELRRPQLFAGAAWPGYPQVSSTALSTKPGGALAGAWAVTRYIGDHGYLRLAAAVEHGMQLLLDGLDRIEHVRVLFEPDAALVAVAADESCDVFTICDELSSRGWHVRPQLSSGRLPATIHLTLSAGSVPRVQEFLDAFKSSVKTSRASGPVQLSSHLVAVLRTLDLRVLDDEALDGLLELVGIDPWTGQLPDRMAGVNAALDAASAPVREALLIAYLDRLTRLRR